MTKVREEIHADEFAWKLASSILEDFKPFLVDDFLTKAEAAIAARNVGDYRKLVVAELEKPFQLKLQYQVVDLLKKFTFTTDVYSQEAVHEMSVKKFIDNQQRLLSFDYEARSELTRRVMFSARGWIGGVLGDYSELEVMEKATFGKKSSVGVPMRKACEGARYEALTGSLAHIQWFEHRYGVWNRPAHLYACRRAKNRKVRMYEEVEVLEAILVNKTWKAKRMIMPNTTIGTLYSSGLGRVVEDRLAFRGYDIKALQPIHGALAQRGSLDGSLVTADQSLASDNITNWHVENLLEPMWANAFKFGRIGKLRLGDKILETPTFCTMGIGFTFPLQTLVFLGLLYGVKDVLGLRSATISVFGDDLIYSREMHDTVLQVFAELGLVINEDKTFSTGYFRESCGFDYFRGIDVRPFHLKQPDSPVLAGTRAEAYLYKVINAVKRRWSTDEVPYTIQWLEGEILRISKGRLLAVPLTYPDTAGVRITLEEARDREIYALPTSDIHGTKSFDFLSFNSYRKPEYRSVPYYFKALRTETSQQSLVVDFLDSPWRKRRCVGSNVHGVVCNEKTPDLEIIQVRDLPHDEQAKLLGRKSGKLLAKALSERIPTVVCQDSGRYRIAKGTTFGW